MGKIFYIMGKSASGKDKIYSRLAGNKELNLKKLILYTTRPVRDGEENGKQYYFTDEKKLQEFKAEGKVIEARAYNTVYGVWNRHTGILSENEKLLRGVKCNSCLYRSGRR